MLTDPAAATPADVVLLAVKAHQTESAAPFLRALSRDGTVVVVLQNGVEQRELVGPHAGGATVLPAVVWVPVEAVAPGPRARARRAPAHAARRAGPPTRSRA